MLAVPESRLPNLITPRLKLPMEEQYHAGQIPSVWHLIYVCNMYTQKRKKEK